MDLFERLIFFTIGAGVGFILGYVVARLRVIEIKVDAVKSEVHEVDEIVKHDRDDRGMIKLTTVMMILALGITAFAAFSAARTNQKLEETVRCLTRYNTNQNETLASRDQAIKDAAQAEIYLWTNYAQLYELGVDSGPKKQARIQEEFLESVLEYRDLIAETQRTRSQYEYDDPDVLKDCEERTR